MTGTRLFTYWISTVILGSILAPILLSIGFGSIDGLFGVMLLSMIVSMITSLPAIIVFYLVLNYQNDNNIPHKQKQRTLMWTHLACGAATFTVLGLMTGSFEVLPAVLVFFCTYTGIGMLFWYYEFKKGSINAEKIESDDTTEKVSNESF